MLQTLKKMFSKIKFVTNKILVEKSWFEGFQLRGELKLTVFPGKSYCLNPD